jgi:hypothetical protein
VKAWLFAWLKVGKGALRDEASEACALRERALRGS